MKKSIALLSVTLYVLLAGCNYSATHSSSSKSVNCTINGKPADPALCNDLKRNPLLP